MFGRPLDGDFLLSKSISLIALPLYPDIDFDVAENDARRPTTDARRPTPNADADADARRRRKRWRCDDRQLIVDCQQGIRFHCLINWRK